AGGAARARHPPVARGDRGAHRHRRGALGRRCRARRSQAAESQPEERVRTTVKTRVEFSLLLWLLPALAAGQSVPSPREALTLDDAVRMALADNRQIASAGL